MPRVLHVCESTQGGTGVFIAGLAEFQIARGDSVSVAVPDGGPVVERLEALGARHLTWNAVAQPGPAVPGEMRELAKHLREVDPDIVHLHSSKAGMVGRLVVRRRRVTVVQPHSWSFFARVGVLRWTTLQWERVAARWADVVLCVSADEERFGRQAGVKADYRVLPNGVDLERFTAPGPDARATARAELGLAADAPIVLCVGRLHRQKNQGALLDAWPAVRASLPDAQLLLLGDGPDRDQLEARAVEGVVFAGNKSDVRPWLAATNVVAMPSRWEGMSLALLEALASARSVVVTDVSGMREVVSGGVGAVVPQDAPGALAEALVTRLSDTSVADHEGKLGRARVEDRHDLRVQHQDIENLYKELLAARRGAA